MATSFALSGDHDNALHQVEKAIAEGATIWLAEFYMGRTLCSHGRYDEAMPHLYRALRARGAQRDLVEWLRVACLCQGQVWKAAYYQTLQALILVAREPKNGLRLIPGAALFSIAVVAGKLRKASFFVLASVLPWRSQLLNVIQPESLELSISGKLLANRQFKATEQVCRLGLRSIPDSIRLLANLAGSLAMQERREDAIAELDKALLLAPENEILRWNRHQIMTSRVLNVRFADSEQGESLENDRER
jgi:tetratricopeptide (TPR) repeat protein